MKTATRFFFERLALLDRLVRAGDYPNAQMLADRLEVSRRTILRDIENARDRLDIPLAFDARRRGYYYSDTTYRLSFTALTEVELRAIRTAQLALAPFRGLPDGPNLARATQKVTLGLIDPLPDRIETMGKARSFRFSTGSRADPDKFIAIDHAIQRCSRVEMRYYSASSDTESDRQVDPYHLVSIDGQWFLVAYCHRRRAIRMFNASRILTWTPTEHHFDPPQSFNIDQYLERSFAMIRGGEDECHTIRLRFRGEAVRYVREQTWHPSQTGTATPEGDWLVGLEVSHLREVERLVLSWGADCLVLDPPELRERVAQTLARAAAQYREPTGPTTTPTGDACR